jgi:hypothetical protein
MTSNEKYVKSTRIVHIHFIISSEIKSKFAIKKVIVIILSEKYNKVGYLCSSDQIEYKYEYKYCSLCKTYIIKCQNMGKFYIYGLAYKIIEC